jgi:NADPH-dependent glutamate synthase beta subunit-like oxidoreductase/NAD-dependent dihydropyrimidine dehydrogenase PreA subunit
VALIAQQRYREAYDLIHSALPFPSVCGRVCNHYCEEACSRSKFDEAVNIMALKRYVADWAYRLKDDLPANSTETLELTPEKKNKLSSGKKVAVIGAGPAGLTAARDLVRSGHEVTVFDANSAAGGMMRVGIPPHRLPYDQLDWEIQQILLEGVDLKLNTWVDDIPGLLKNGYDAVLIATGAHEAVKISIENADHPANWLSLDFLKRACLGEKIDLSGRKIIVLGGGDVAMDAARVAVRLGTPEVRLVSRGLRASFNEIQEAEEEGIDIIRGRVFKKVVLDNGDIAGVECLEADIGEVIDGKRQFTELPGTEHLIPGDLVIWAVGQKPDFTFLPKDERIAVLSPQGIKTDNQMMTTMKGVFTAGDVRRGTTFFVVDAVGEGHHAARAIDHFLGGKSLEINLPRPQEVILSQEEMQNRVDQREEARIKRTSDPRLPVSDRKNNFCEVDLTLEEEAALQEAGRCLVCGPCSECMACVEVCEPGAVIHNQTGSRAVLDFDAVIIADDSMTESDDLNICRIPPDDMYAGSAAAFQVMSNLKVIPAKPLPILSLEASPENITDRIGLFLCQCGGEISDNVDTRSLAEEAASWSGIVHTQEMPFSCSKEAADEMREIIQEQNLNKVILAACTCCSLDQVCFSCTYQRLRCKENLGVFSSLETITPIEFVNIREQCAWVHKDNPEKATATAKSLIKTALARLRYAESGEPLLSLDPKRVLILGNGSAGQVCSSSLNQLGISADITGNIPSKIMRVGGHFQINNEISEARADLLVIAPGDEEELEKFRDILKMPDGRSLLPLVNNQTNSLDFGVIITQPEVDDVTSGRSAAARIAAWMSRINSGTTSSAAEVDKSRCRGCGTCVEVCGFGIPDIIEEASGRYSRIDPKLCLGCGICAALCPSGAITSKSASDLQLEEMLDAILS